MTKIMNTGALLTLLLGCLPLLAGACDTDLDLPPEEESARANAVMVGYVAWQSNGGGCVPTDATAQQDAYWTVTGAGRVKYKGNSTEPLVFSCPVTTINDQASGGEGTVLALYSQDPDGPGDTFEVSARLKSFARNNGSYNSSVCEVHSQTAGQWRRNASGPCKIDFGQAIYWVEVRVERQQPSAKVVEFNAVALENVVF